MPSSSLLRVSSKPKNLFLFLSVPPPSQHKSLATSSSPSMLKKHNLSLKYFINFILLLFILTISFPLTVNGQDLYGAQYANNRAPDEVRQRSRSSMIGAGFDDQPLQQQQPEMGGGDDVVVDGSRQGCQGPWQWQCDSGHCIAQYDLCDGITQCPDDSDEKNCRGRFGPSQHINSFRQPDAEPKHPAAAKPATTHPPTTTSSPDSKDNGSLLLPLKLVFAGAAAFILVAGLAHVFVKRRQLQASVRNYRKGDRLIDDEDDLLISQMYS